MTTFSSSISARIDDAFDYFNESNPLESMRNLDKIQVERREKELEDKKFVKSGFEQQYTIDYLNLGKRERKKRNKEERSKTGGSDWFDIKAPELNDDIKLDLEVIKMRGALFRKHQYKRKATEEISQHFHLGKVIEDGREFYSSRIPRKQRGTSIVDELIKDNQFMKSAKERASKIYSKKVQLKKEKAIRQKKIKKQMMMKKRKTEKSEKKSKKK